MTQADEQHATASQPSASWRQRLWEPCDSASVVFFRVAFASMALWHIGLVLASGWIDYYFTNRPYHLSFFGFEWVQALGGTGMWRIHLLMGLAALGVGLGAFYRLSAILFFVTFTYTLLAEAALYQNHYYLMSLLAFLFILIPAHRSFSVDALVFPDKASPFLPNWCRWSLMFLIALPYFYGGIAKLNGDWLQAMPMGIWIPQKTHIPIIGPYLAQPWVAWALSYGGLVLDLTIVPLLLWRRTRLFAYLAVVIFHLMNSVLFKIDIFPWTMILLTTIFFAPDWPRKLLRRPSLKIPKAAITASHTPSLLQRATLGIVGIFVVWQLIFPLRHYVYPGNALWTEEGQNFAWRMMLHNKDVFIRFYATDGVTGKIVQIPVSKMLTQRQLLDIAKSPEQTAAVARFLAEGATKAGLQKVEIHAVSILSLDGRKPQLIFDPDLDLLTVERSWKHQSWINPLTEPLRAEPWDVPSKEWPQAVGIKLPKAMIPQQRAPTAR
ncbi:HTTM domain-containing protein [Symmachiella dynata]|mgnify:CR=1 FL=1|uniref:HTTM domain-containing protein n=1 Tax=Symmachiella dynata TaxID=2527995 RepID=UPI0030EBAD2E